MFWTRLSSGIVLVVIAALALGYGGLVLAVLLWAVSLAALLELTKAFYGGEGHGRRNGLELLGMAGVTFYYLALYFAGDDTWLLLCLVGFFLAVMFVYVIRFPKYHASQAAALVFSFLYAPVMLSFVYRTRSGPQGFYLVWMILLSAWGCDTCAYVAGMLFGHKKIFPRLSPKKTLEGCIGGVLGAGLLGWLYGAFVVERAFPEQSVSWAAALICSLGAVMGMVGDLAASAVKRNFEIKDYGKLIPGHGGIMDRFDSVIITAPMTYLMTILLLGR